MPVEFGLEVRDELARRLVVVGEQRGDEQALDVAHRAASMAAFRLALISSASSFLLMTEILVL